MMVCVSRSTVTSGGSAALQFGGERLDVAFRQADRQHAVLKAVPVENIAEARRNDAAKAEVRQRPDRVFARGTATEIIAGHQNLGVSEARLIENEIGVFDAVAVIAPGLEAERAEIAALIADQPVDRNDDFGVDIDPHQWRGRSGHPDEFVHGQ